MGFTSSRVRVRFSYIIAVVTFLGAVFSYGFSVWSASRSYDAALPKDASDSVIRGVLSFHQASGGFPKNFVEVEETVWKHKKPPNFGDTGRAFNAYNYNYIYFRLGAHECAIYAIPGGGRRAEAPSFYFYVTTLAVWKWKGPALGEEDVTKLRPVRPGTEEALLLGVLGMTEQPRSEIRMKDAVRKASIVNFASKE